MRKRILTIIAAAISLALGAFIWRLDIPHWQRLDLSKLNGAAVSVVSDASGMPVGALHGAENRRPVSIDRVPEAVQLAFIAAEDLRFYRHHGVDPYRMLGALWNDLRTLSYAQGASTITQQLIKLTHLSGEKRLSRKAQEIVLALALERALDKRQILEAYLNTVYFGHGAYGIEAASQTYFDKSAADLTLSEGALLAGIIKAPSSYAPHLNPARSVARRDAVLRTMAEAGFITEAQSEHARAEALELAAAPAETAQYAWYMDAVLAEAASVTGLSASALLSGGYAIETGLDPAMQAAAEARFADGDAFPADAADGTPVQAALIAMDTATGEVRAVVGGRRYDVAMGLDRATQSRRQPGSAFKPVSTYAAAIDAYGFVPSSTIDDTPRTFEGGYAPGNAGGNSYGTVTLREALSRSLNIATVDLAELIGVDALRSYAQRFGLPLSEKDRNLSLALGALTDGVSPAELCAAYCALANGGTRVRAHFIRRIRNSRGRVIYSAEGDGGRAVSDATAYMLTDMLKSAAASGSARALTDCGMPVAGKTGTVSEADGGTRDIWTAAYTPELAVTAWMGFDVPQAGRSLPASEGGSGYPARMCASFLKAVSERLSGRDFPRPDSVRTALVDAVSLRDEHIALLSTERTPAEYTVREVFPAGSLPERYSDRWDAPQSATDLQLITGSGETPVLTFTVQDAFVEYLLLRTTGGRTEQIAQLTGSPGEVIRFADTEHDLAQPADYALLPRNALLYAVGTLLTGAPSPTVHYAPGGLLNKLMGAGEAEATQAPTEIELSDIKPLFD